MTPLEISKDMKKYIRTAKQNDKTVLCAVDVDKSYSNLEGYSIFLNVPELLLSEPSDDLAKQFLRGYILCKGRTISEKEILADVEEVVTQETANVLEWGKKVIERHARMKADAEWPRELNRRDNSKPKVKE